MSFIVFEGIEGTGKTTLAKKAYEYLVAKGKSVLYTFEPTDGVYGKKIREAVDRLTFETEKDLFFRDRQEHVNNVIIPSMACGNIVICDRYYPSSVIYQGTMSGNPHSVLLENEKAFPYPDLTIIIDCHSSIAMSRLKDRRRLDKFERNEVNLEKMRQLYLEIFSRRKDVVVINGSGTIEDTFKLVAPWLEQVPRIRL
jgi:dTMP kinase